MLMYPCLLSSLPRLLSAHKAAVGHNVCGKEGREQTENWESDSGQSVLNTNHLYSSFFFGSNVLFYNLYHHDCMRLSLLSAFV